MSNPTNPTTDTTAPFPLKPETATDAFEGHTPTPWQIRAWPEKAYDEIKAEPTGHWLERYYPGFDRENAPLQLIACVEKAVPRWPQMSDEPPQTLKDESAANARLIAAAPTLLAENRAKDATIAQLEGHVVELRAALHDALPILHLCATPVPSTVEAVERTLATTAPVGEVKSE